jgi:mannosyl-oligosaccharide glucosidase
MLVSQSGPENAPGSFRWRGRSPGENKLLPNTLASGLDDFPRSAFPTSLERHADLLCWMVRGTAIVGRVQSVVKEFELESVGEKSEGHIHQENPDVVVPDEERSHDSASSSISSSSSISKNKRGIFPPESEMDFTQLSGELTERLLSEHWDETRRAFLDVGLTENNLGIVSEARVRCQRPDTGAVADIAVPVAFNGQPLEVTTVCPPEFPNLLFRHLDPNTGSWAMYERLHYNGEAVYLGFIPHLGYGSMLPLALKLLTPSSVRLTALLDALSHPQALWTDYGIRSLAKTDPFYWRDNAPGDRPYWRYAARVVSATHAYASVHDYSLHLLTMQGSYLDQYELPTAGRS